MRSGMVALIITACVGISAPAPGAQAQDEAERRLWDSEFLKKRQTTTTPPATPPRPSPVYKRTSPVSPPEVDTAGEVLGVTIWRLRQSTASDPRESRLLLQDDNSSATSEWTPERVEAETVFRAGESIRLSVESPRGGYLYVIDREQYADGTTSDPYLIFPTLRIRGGDNAVSPGKVVELPDGPAFRLRAMRPDYSGELLTLLVTSEPLPGVSAGPSARPLDRALVEQWERQWLAGVERFEMVGGAGKAYTGAEKQAGTEGRLLTQADELPQTLYHVSAKPGTPLAVRVALRIAK